MKFKGRLLQGTLVKRYKRFFIDIKYKNKIITAHCPNSGSMMGLLNKGNKIWFSKSNNPNRKLKYTLEIIEVKKEMVGINTLLPLSNNPIMEPEFGQWAVIILFLYFISAKNLLYLLTNAPCNNLSLNFI